MLENMIEIKNLTKTIGKTEILRGINLTIRRGERLVIIGPSGSGKSTLLRCMNCLEAPTSGEVSVEGKGFLLENGKFNEKHAASLRVEVGMVFQRFNLFPNMTALENVMAAQIRIRKKSKEDARQTAEKYLAKVGLSERKDHYPSELSGGQQQRVAIARALAMEPKVMLFDEATSALDPELVGEVLEVIRELASEGMTMALVTHEMRFAEEVGSRIVFLDQGRILEEGNPVKILSHPENDRIRSFLKRLGTVDEERPALEPRLAYGT